MLLALALLVVGPLPTHAAAPVPVIAVGAPMPPLRGDLLDGRPSVLPDSARGVNLVLFLGFTYASRHDVERWVSRLQHDFPGEPRFRWYEVPVIGGAGRIARPFIEGGMRRGIPKPLHAQVLMVYGGGGNWKQRVGFAERDVGYVLVVDGAGRVTWTGRGPFSEAGYHDLAEHLRRF